MIQILLLILTFISARFLIAQEPKILFSEDFEDNNFAQRGWYDNLKGTLTSDEHIEGSNFSLECKFLQGARTPEGGTPGRHLFEETDEVCISYYVKYSENYIGSGKPYHPHEFHFVTNKDSKWVGPAFTHLTTYTEHNGGKPLLGIQDGENIDQTRIKENLVGITEQRAVAGCNGSTDGYPDDCYRSGNFYVNGKIWKTETKYFSDEPGKYYKNDWHHIEAYFKLNSIVDGIGITDGIIKYWYDGELLIDHEDVLLRTGEHPDMKFNQFLLTPYIGDGSPVEQTMWVDNLTVSTSRLIPNAIDENRFVDLTVSPNPASDYIEINFGADGRQQTADGRQEGEIRIYNTFGQCVLSVGVNGNVPLQRVDVSGLPVGMYYLRIGNFVEKFLVVK